jgi:hypothetical protein
MRPNRPLQIGQRLMVPSWSCRELLCIFASFQRRVDSSCFQIVTSNRLVRLAVRLRGWESCLNRARVNFRYQKASGGLYAGL